MTLTHDYNIQNIMHVLNNTASNLNNTEQLRIMHQFLNIATTTTATQTTFINALLYNLDVAVYNMLELSIASDELVYLIENRLIALDPTTTYRLSYEVKQLCKRIETMYV